jgi:hypothetical protein
MVCISIPAIENEEPMTFQVGMACADGVLLASDRKLTNIVGYRHGRLTPKIEVYENENIAHCSAGDGFCDTFTNIVREHARDGKVNFAEGSFLHVKEALGECVLQARTKEKGFRDSASAGRNHPLPECVGGRTLLVFRGRGVVSLWSVDTNAPYPNPLPVGIGDKVLSDGQSAAVFFLEHYFYKVPNTLNALIPLAVHTVLMAKNDFIDGLQVGLFTPDTFRTLTEEELKPFVDLSNGLDSDTAERLTNWPSGLKPLV